MSEIETKLVPEPSWKVGVLSPGTFEVSRSKELVCQVWSFEGPATGGSDESAKRYYARVVTWSVGRTGAGYRVYEGAGPDATSAMRRAVRDMEDKEGVVVWYTVPSEMPSPSAIYGLVVGVGPSLQNLASAVEALTSSEG